MKQVFRLHIVIVLVSYAGFASGQVAPGQPSFIPQDCIGPVCTNLQNLNNSLNVPVYSKNGAFPFNASLGGGESYFSYNGTSLQPGILAQPITPIVNGILSPFGYTQVFATTTTSVPSCPTGDGTGAATKYSGWYLLMTDGTVHSLPSTDIAYGGASCTSTLTDQVVDGTGWTVTVVGGTYNSGTQAGVTVVSSGGLAVDIATATIQDAQSTPNNIRYSSQEFFDTMGLEVMVVNGNAAGQLSWFDVNGGNPTESQTLIGATLKTSFGCAGKADYPATSYLQGLTTAISFPDGSNLGLSWETNQVLSGDYTGRLLRVLLRDAVSTVLFNYNPGGTTSAPYNLNCTYLVPNSMTRQTSDGTVTYKWAHTTTGNTTTRVDVGGNKTVFTFSNAGNATVLTESQDYANIGTVSVPSYSTTATRTQIHCYGGGTGQPANCATASVSEPVAERNDYAQLSGMSNYSRQQTHFDSYGNVTSSAQYDFGGTSALRVSVTTYGRWNGASCVPVSSTINNTPCVITTSEGTGGSLPVVSKSEFTYDAYGNVLTSYISPNGGTSFLSNPTANSYYPNGAPHVLYDLAGTSTTYSYLPSYYTLCSTCSQYPFATSLTKNSLTTYSHWNGIGGMKVSDTDASGNTTTYASADPWNRPTTITDPLTNVVTNAYSPTSLESSFLFNGSVSIQNVTTTLDGYGRPINIQKQQGVGASNYDTVSTSYTFTGVNPTVFTSNPCSQSLGNYCGGTYGPTNAYDMLGRQVTAVQSGSNATVTTSYLQNDVESILSPAPSGENDKSSWTEQDGLGRPTKACAVSSTVSGNVTCGMAANTSVKGILTTTSYSAAIGSQTATSCRGPSCQQPRSMTTDGLGRVTQKATPEGGVVANTYDYQSGAPCAGTYAYPGHLVLRKFANGAFECYDYDGLGRLWDISAGYSGGGATACVHFQYDNSTGVLGAIPAGITVSNVYGRMVEAATDNCAPPRTLTTDEWFSYDKDGRVTDMWELTPHSGVYYHSVATFFGNGALDTVQLANPSLYTATFAIDGEGRSYSLKQGSKWIVSADTYSAASQPSSISLGTGDQDTYTYDPNTENMLSYWFVVGTSLANEVGELGWNANGTLANLSIADTFNSGGGQTETFTHDDLGRLVSDSNGSTWAQSFSYDQYDNITKTGSISWACPTCYNSANNQYNSTMGTVSYDNSGNLLTDPVGHTYTWSPFSKLASVDASTCGTNGECETYDALGRLVEVSKDSAYTEIWYTQAGKAFMNGSTIQYAYWPTPGGGTLTETGNGGSYYYQHKDWLGRAPIISKLGSPGSVYGDYAFAPYGEIYDTFGTVSLNEENFTSDTPDLGVANMFHSDNRELNASEGRWLSPDPSGSGWNQYAYATNPNGFIDPSGLQLEGPGQCSISGDSCTGGGGGFNNDSGSGFCDASGYCGSATGVNGMGGVNIYPGYSSISTSGAAGILAQQNGWYAQNVNIALNAQNYAAGQQPPFVGASMPLPGMVSISAATIAFTGVDWYGGSFIGYDWGSWDFPAYSISSDDWISNWQQFNQAYTNAVQSVAGFRQNAGKTDQDIYIYRLSNDLNVPFMDMDDACASLAYVGVPMAVVGLPEVAGPLGLAEGSGASLLSRTGVAAALAGVGCLY